MIEDPFLKKKEDIQIGDMFSDNKVEAAKINEEITKEASADLVEEVVKVVRPQPSAKQAILAEYGGLESNIPINSPYWRS